MTERSVFQDPVCFYRLGPDPVSVKHLVNIRPHPKPMVRHMFRFSDLIYGLILKGLLIEYMKIYDF